LKEIFLNHELGEIYHLHLTRTAPGPVRPDVNCMWDLASHDISILQYLLGKYPTEVSAVGQSYLQKNIEDIAIISLKYPKDIFVSICVSWFYPNKVRKMVIIGSEKSAIFDDMEKGEKLKLFSKDGKISIPNVIPSEPLKNECIHFLDCIKKGNKPLTDGEVGLEVVKILEFAQKSLENGGNFIRVKL
jgi:predicted dehydrogenase